MFLCCGCGWGLVCFNSFLTTPKVHCTLPVLQYGLGFNMNLCLEIEVLKADALHENLQLFHNQRMQFADCNPVNFVNIEAANAIAALQFSVCALTRCKKESIIKQ